MDDFVFIRHLFAGSLRETDVVGLNTNDQDVVVYRDILGISVNWYRRDSKIKNFLSEATQNLEPAP